MKCCASAYDIVSHKPHKRAIIVGPLPPAIGGIATIVGYIIAKIGHTPCLSFINSTKPSSRIASLMLPFTLAGKLIAGSLSLRRGRVLFFSSAYRSFWEKCIWSMVVRATGSRAIMVMVDGNFPAFYENLPAILKTIARYLVGGLHLMAAQSERWRSYYTSIFPNATIGIVGAGIDTDFFSPADIREEKELIRILYVGWIMEPKGIFDLIDAAGILKRDGLQFRVRLIGPLSENMQELSDRIERRALDGVVEIMPPLKTKEELLREYQSADVFAFPSHAEGFPLALLEAISTGLPCVGTDVGGIPDILGEGSCGIIVKPNKPDEMSAALRKLITNSELRAELGCKARMWALTQYTLADCVRSYAGLMGIESQI